MIGWLNKRSTGPLGIDLGGRSIKLVQFSADRQRILQTIRWELPNLTAGSDEAARLAQLRTTLCKGVEDHKLRGSEVVLCLTDRQLMVQNIRVPRQAPDMDRIVTQEIAGRIPFNVTEAEIRYVESADVRQGETIVREVIVFACHRPLIASTLEIITSAGLRPISVDVEPAALARSYATQFRRESDQSERALLVHMGYSRTLAVIAQGEDLLFVKYIDIGGSHLDLSMSRQLKMELGEAALLRRHNADRKSDLQDPEVARGVAEATRPVLDRLGGELAMCLRYHSVTFRGQNVDRLVLGGGEATPALAESLGKFLSLPGELSDPFRHHETILRNSRRGQWDIAAGLAMQLES